MIHDIANIKVILKRLKTDMDLITTKYTTAISAYGRFSITGDNDGMEKSRGLAHAALDEMLDNNTQYAHFAREMHKLDKHY